ncbi:MAG: serine/threonine-protein kinase [Acidobacteriia bacterium]|nr:serine/threonine-protein kinase [Terriglobia bacterium]
MSLDVGKRMGPYTIVGPLGAGGMGEVYRARDPRLGREVAIKVLPAALADVRDRLERFEQEARAAGALNHPNILTVFDIGQVDGSPYVVCELLEGETVRQWLRTGVPPLRKVIDYARQMALGLAAAHEKGIVHRDLKPENVFITKDGRVKILDFGLAKLTRPEMAPGQTNAPTISADSDPGMLLGTVGYMSPEQVRGKSADHRSDLFSFGCILYEMLSGQRAFHRESSAETLSAILKDDPPPVPDERKIPPGLARIVEHCLEKNPDDRFQSTRDLAFDVEALSTTSSTASVPLSSRYRARLRWSPLLAAPVLAAVALLGYWAGTWKGAKPQPPSFRQLTFGRGPVTAGRFAPDGSTVLYSAGWEGEPVHLFSSLGTGAESTLLPLPEGWLLAVSSKGEIAMLLHTTFGAMNVGTLARVPLGGGAPHEILEDVQGADWSPDGLQLAVVHNVGGRVRLEYPIGKVLYETSGGITFPRISPRGDMIAFLDHPVALDDRGSVAVVNLAGEKKTLTQEWNSELGLAWSPNGDEIWYTASQGTHRYLDAVSVSGKQRGVLRAPGGLILQDVGRNGRVLLTQENDRCGVRGRGAGQSKERELSWLNWSFPGDISTDGKTLLFGEQGEDPYRVYVRGMDGSPAVRLGEGSSQSLSPDGKWALTLTQSIPAQVVRLPTGPGEAEPVTQDGISHLAAKYLPDGRQFAFCGNEPGHGLRLYVQDVEHGKARAISPEGVCSFGYLAISPDGKWVAVNGTERKPVLFPVDGGEPRPIPGRAVGEAPVQISADQRSVYVVRPGDIPARIRQVEIESGREKEWKVLMPVDPAGLVGIAQIVMTRDANAYAYTYCTYFSELYLVSGLQ